MHVLELVNIYRPDEELSLTMSLNTKFRVCWIWGVAHAPKDDWVYNGHHPWTTLA